LVTLERILVADDEPDTLNLVKTILEGKGYQVVLASNGAEALEKAETEMPDLVMLDVVMPAKNGWDVCKILKSQTKTRHIPVVIFTVLSTVLGKDISQRHSNEAGCDGYISKPFTPQGLLDEIRKHLDLAKTKKTSN